MSHWSLVYDAYDPQAEGLREALCTLGNGYLCTRGAAIDCDADDIHYPGTYVAGLYDRATSRVAGRDVENEDLVNLPNWLPLTIRIEDGPWFRLDAMEILSFRQELDLKSGMLRRDIRLRDDEGRTTLWRERRLVSMDDQHIAAMALEIEPEDWSGRMWVRSCLDGGVINHNVARYRALESRHLETLDKSSPEDDTVFLRSRTRQSRLEIVLAARTRVYRGNDRCDGERRACPPVQDRLGHEIAVEMRAGVAVAIEKIVALYTSDDRAISEHGLEACAAVGRAPRFDAIARAHVLAWARLWDDFDMSIEAPDVPDADMKLRLHAFHLLQSVSEHSIDRDVGVPARGWHGEAYRGHVFWDELFIFPFLNLRRPVITRALLRYRYRRIGAARRHAAQSGYAGALYPWQSGSDGREETQIIHLNPKSGKWKPDASHRQRHINAAVAYNVWHYYEVTGDHEFMRDYGAEMILEIARFWSSIAQWNAARGRFDICGVMGPDEFHTAYPGRPPEEEGGLDNNAYTNVMAAYCLHRALDVVDMLPPARRTRLLERLGISDEDIARFDEISRKLFVPFHDECIISQFEGYERLDELDWDGLRARHGNIQRLDRILDAEGDDPNRYKASKQADVLMLFYLFSAEELTILFERLGIPFRREWIPANIDYYMARTSHGSTLSHVVHSWVLARADRPMALDHLRRGLDADINDIQGGTTKEGIHLGAMAGTVDIVQRCLTGLATQGGILHFDPVLPKGLDRIEATVQYRRQRLRLTIDRKRLTVHSEQTTAPPITIAYRGHYREMSPGDTYAFRLVVRGEG